MRRDQRGAYTTISAQIQLMRRTSVRRLHVPVQIFLMEVGSIAQVTLKLPDSSLLLVNWVYIYIYIYNLFLTNIHEFG